MCKSEEKGGFLKIKNKIYSENQNLKQFPCTGCSENLLKWASSGCGVNEHKR